MSVVCACPTGPIQATAIPKSSRFTVVAATNDIEFIVEFIVLFLSKAFNDVAVTFEFLSKIRWLTPCQGQ